ncbi:uncharacterized protein LOC143226586 isoform X2 [Tachypleus tridentatus]|uniref:uncharacterized protein LOC143226586 isoform X2 n=1 Tax=Tachypleus tridentatus TaxID=6853 RepID=UPI003FD56F93
MFLLTACKRKSVTVIGHMSIHAAEGKHSSATNQLEQEGLEIQQMKCTQCQVISGLGIFGAGTYVLYHARQAKQVYSKMIGLTFGIGLLTVGVARLGNFPPFQH